MEQVRMLYRRYRQSFPDCESIGGSYDPEGKTIIVLIPDGRMKPSGTRGKCYHWMEFRGTDRITGKPARITIKAIDREHALKQLPGDCKWIID